MPRKAAKQPPEVVTGPRPLIAAGTVPVIEHLVGDRMRQARKNVKADQAAMASILEVSRQTIIDWETNKRKPSVPVMFAWAHITGVDMQWLRCGDCQFAGTCSGGRECPKVSHGLVEPLTTVRDPYLSRRHDTGTIDLRCSA